jgi:filamentous haemagglutinin family N-terminal domain
MLRKSLSKNVRFSKTKLALAIAAHMLASSGVLAAPSGGEVVGGAGSIEQQGSDTTIIQESNRLAIDWQAFDISANERVEFVQPGQSAVALNRILGNKGSEILGRIDANGHVILVNPRGVVFGESATVNVGGLIASGLQINPDDFMNGDLVFKRIEGTDGTVINSGMINAAAGGNVALLGAQVENRGLISAKLGSVILASGKEAVLTFDESGLLGVRVDESILQDELGSTAAVANNGEIRAESGRILKTGE